MELTYLVKGAGLSDLNALRKLEQDCFGGDAWPLWDLIGVLMLPGLVRLKAVVGGQMAGFVGGDPHPSEGIGWIATLGVLPQYRRQGIASAMLAACEDAHGAAFRAPERAPLKRSRPAPVPRPGLPSRSTFGPATISTTKMRWCWKKGFDSFSIFFRD